VSAPAKNPPRVAIIVPAYNQAVLLSEAIESILAQTYQDWEAVIVDDASHDDSYEVARSFAARDPERITAMRLERNQGVAGARNAGIRASRGGELICLLDHDDYWMENYLENSVSIYDAAVAEGRRVGVVSSNGLMLTPEGITGETWFDRNGRIDEVDLDKMIQRNYLLARALFPRVAYDEAGGAFEPTCRGSDDYDLWLRIMELGYEAITVEEALVIYRDHPGAFSRNRLAYAEGASTCYRRALKRGKMSRSQLRAVRARLRHNRALQDRELVYEAIARGDRLRAVSLAIRAAPRGLLAFAQDPHRWSEWLGGIWRRGTRRSQSGSLADG
jgi:glycosyltransferase involved in cell wall biosynthesis